LKKSLESFPVVPTFLSSLNPCPLKATILRQKRKKNKKKKLQAEAVSDIVRID